MRLYTAKKQYITYGDVLLFCLLSSYDAFLVCVCIRRAKPVDSETLGSKRILIPRPHTRMWLFSLYIFKTQVVSLTVKFPRRQLYITDA